MPNVVPAIERFWAKVDKRGGPEACWLWSASKTPSGYGVFCVSAKRRAVRAHRWIWEHQVGDIPEGLTIDHLCKQRSCQNIAHMEIVTASENSIRANANRPRCPKGHVYDITGYVRRAGGSRWCLVCKGEQAAIRSVRERAERAASRVEPVLRSACSKGHTYTEENTYWVPSTGKRACKACKRLFKSRQKRIVA